MGPYSWAQQVTDRFFEAHEEPSQWRCNSIAQSVTGALTVRNVDNPGSTSYTVVCNGCSGPQQDVVISFRDWHAWLDEDMVKLAEGVHGSLAPEPTFHGRMKHSDPPLLIYKMPYLQGSSCIEVLPLKAEMDPDEEAKHDVLLKHLARYFTRCWSKPQLVDLETRTKRQEEIRKRFKRLAEEAPPVLSNSTVSKLIETLPLIFSQNYPQVLTHGEFSVTNILVDESNFEITGIVDWSLASVMPFGMDMDILYMTAGYMAQDGWHDYECKKTLQSIFWKTFWALSGIEGGECRSRIQGLAEAASQIGAILRLAFQRDPHGSPSEEILVSESRMKQLRAWFGE